MRGNLKLYIYIERKEESRDFVKVQHGDQVDNFPDVVHRLTAMHEANLISMDQGVYLLMRAHKIFPASFISSFSREIGWKAWGSWTSLVLGTIEMRARKESGEGNVHSLLHTVKVGCQVGEHEKREFAVVQPGKASGPFESWMPLMAWTTSNSETLALRAVWASGERGER